MFTKFKIYLYIILCMISLVSVGFSSWTIYGLDEELVEQTITTDNVINSKDYITCTSIESFDYSQYGYLDKNGRITSEGNIVVKYSINLKKCKELFSENSLVMILRLQYSDNFRTNLNLFNEIKSTSDPQGIHNIKAIVSCNISSENVSVTGSPIPNLITQQYSYQIALVNILSDYYKENDITTHNLELTLTYKLTSDIGLFFYENIYYYLYTDFLNQNSNLYFKIDSYLTEY